MRRAAALLLAGAAALAAADDTIEITNPAVDELSGLARSHADPGVLWGHNDSGGGSRLYRIGLHGEDYGEVRVKDAPASDWEDIAAFDDAGGPALLIADTGDNFALRSFGVLYAVRDPGRRGTPALLWRLDFRFPDGARDCEAVAVDAQAREILLLSKRDLPPRLYRLPLPASPPRGAQVAEFVGEVTSLPLSTLLDHVKSPIASHFAYLPTALDLAPDGSAAVVATPRHVYLFRRGPGMSWLQALQRPPLALEPPRAMDQVEAATFSADGRDLFVGSEGRPGRMARLPLPP